MISFLSNIVPRFSLSSAVCISGLACLLNVTAGAQIVINEVHYDPDPKTDFLEFIELQNVGDVAIDIGGWHFENGVEFIFPAGTEIGPQEYVLVGEDAVALEDRFFPSTPSVPQIFEYAGTLDNDGEKLELVDAVAGLVDEVDYQAEFPWPVTANGDGDSMQLIHPSLDNDLGGSWRGAIPTPGRINSVFSTNAPPQVRQVKHEPKQPISSTNIIVSAKVTDPDGVGAVVLSYQVVAPGDYIPAYLPLSRNALMNSPTTPLTPNPAFEDSANWTRLLMFDDGQGADLVAGDSIYTTSIPGQNNRSLVRYRIQAVDDAATASSIKVPYSNDPSLNFACFVYDGVPDWTASDASTHFEGPGHVYTSELLTSLPVYTMITRDADRRQAYAYESTGDSSWQIPKGSLVARKVYNWECAVVYDGVVYDHVGYRLRQRNYRYNGNGKRSMRFRFNRGNYFQARDEDGKKLEYKWSHFSTSQMANSTYGLRETMNSKLWRMIGVECPMFLPAHMRMIDGAEEAPTGTNGQYLGDFFGLATIVEDIDGILLDNRGLPKGNMYKLKDGVYDGNELQRYQSRTAVTDASDFANVRANVNPSKDEAWLEQHVDWEQWYKYHTMVEAVRHYDFGALTGHFKNRAWYFKPAEGSAYGKLRIIPHDHAASWSKGYHDSLNDEGRGIGTGFPWYAAFGSVTRPHTGPEKEGIVLGYRNYMRHFRDLLWQREEIEMMIDSHIAMLKPFSLADYDRWVGGPAEAGASSMNGIDSMGDSMKAMAFDLAQMYMVDIPGGRAAWLDQLTADADIPETPVITYTGPTNHVIGQLAFETTEFSDPQGSNSFAAMEWRIAEVEPSAPETATPVNLMPYGSVWKYLDIGSDQGTAWREPDFDDSSWAEGPAILGYGEGDESTVVSYGPNSSAKYPTTYFRKTFTLTDVASLGQLRLLVLRDDGVVVYLNGNMVLSDNMPSSFNYSSYASGNAPNDGNTPVEVVIPNEFFNEGSNTLAVEMHQQSATSSDIGFDFAIETAPDVTEVPADPNYEWVSNWESGELDSFSSDLSLPALATRSGRCYRVRVRHQDNSGRWSHWSAPYEFVAGEADAELYCNALVVSEVMYHPVSPSVDELAAGYADDDEFEFVEIQNVGDQALDLRDIRFTKGVDFDFDGSAVAVLQPGEYALVVKDLAAFEMRYGTGLPVAGVFSSGKLDNGGELLKLSFGAGTAVQEFVYDDSEPWPQAPDGQGASLVLRRPQTLPDHSLAASWRASQALGGSPGAADYIVFVGDPNEDLDTDGRCALMEYAVGSSDRLPDGCMFNFTKLAEGGMMITFNENQYAGDLETELQTSADMKTWQTAGPEFRCMTHDQGDGLGMTTVTSEEAGPVFFRYRVIRQP